MSQAFLECPLLKKPKHFLWIRVQAAGGYVKYHPEQDNYSLSAEQAVMFANERSPALKNR